MSKADLRLDWCSYQAAKWAVEHWHYSKTMPSGKLVMIGVWEHEKYIGCVLFGRGATPNLSKHHGLQQIELCELVRVALTNHESEVSRIVSIAIKMLRRQSPGVRLVVSFADCDHDHIGSIYQAGGWIYVGKSNESGSQGFIIRGKEMHRRSVGAAGWVQSLGWLREHIDANAKEMITLGKHKYLYPLDPAMRAQIEPLRKPYPKRERGETDSAASTNSQTGGASPTRSLSEL